MGKTEDVWLRLSEHFNGKGSAWTRLYRPVGVEMVTKCKSSFDEDNWTKRTMEEHGIINVRGGSYTTLNISTEEERMLMREMNTWKNECFRCGGKGHFAKNCKRLNKKQNSLV